MFDYYLYLLDCVQKLKIDTLFTLITPFILFIIGNTYNKKLTILKNNFEKSNIVHKVQFEKEFEYYTAIWGSLQELFEIRTDLRSLLKCSDDYAKIEERFYSLFDEYYSLWTKLLKINNSYSPFFPSIIKYKIERISMAILSYRKIFQHFYINNYFNSTIIDIIDIRYFRLYDILEYLTRQRIESLKIVE